MEVAGMMIAATAKVIALAAALLAAGQEEKQEPRKAVCGLCEMLLMGVRASQDCIVQEMWHIVAG